ncbi:MAG: glutathione synthase [Bacteroidia bacterium]
MNICFLVNQISTEYPTYASILLAFAAHKRGHNVYLAEVGGLTYYPDGQMGTRARHVHSRKFKNTTTFLEALKNKVNSTQVFTRELDVLWLRYNPAEEVDNRSWAQNAGIVFGQIAEKNDVLVLNHPGTLSFAINKMYFQHFPAIVRPRTIITRNADEIMNFYEQMNKQIVLKPLLGSGGTDVFLLKDEATNLNQIVQAINRSGYVIAQEYLPEAVKGDTRILMVNGKPLTVKNKYCAISRVNKTNDVRSNISAGGVPKKAKITDKMLELAGIVGPKLRHDGLFYAGLDIAGDKLMEINVISAGNLQSACTLEETDFTAPIIDAIERKVYYRKLYGNSLTNRELATMD